MGVDPPGTSNTENDGPYFIVGLSKTDTALGKEKGAEYQIVAHRRVGGYSLSSAMERVFPATTTEPLPVPRGQWLRIVVHKFWSKVACGAGCNFASPTGGVTEMWVIEAGRPVRRWADASEPTLWVWPPGYRDPPSSDAMLCADEQIWWTRRTEGQISPVYAKLGLYGARATPQLSLTYYWMKVARGCDDVWSPASGTPCPR